MIEELKQIGLVLRLATGMVHIIIDRYLAAYGQSIQRYIDQVDTIWVGDEEPSDEELIP